MVSNLPPGVTDADHEGEKISTCAVCGDELGLNEGTNGEEFGVSGELCDACFIDMEDSADEEEDEDEEDEDDSETGF